MSQPAPTDEAETLRLAKLVKLMRHAQGQYFAGDRSPACLALCRDLERRVDRAVAWVLAHRQGVLPLDGQTEPSRPPRQIPLDPTRAEPYRGPYTSGDRDA